MQPATVQRLVNKKFNVWLNDIVFELEDVSLSRRELVDITNTPCTRSAQLLQRACRDLRIRTSGDLFLTGRPKLLQHVGVRPAWLAACVLEFMGLDVTIWIDLQSPASVAKSQIRLVHSRIPKQKSG